MTRSLFRNSNLRCFSKAWTIFFLVLSGGVVCAEQNPPAAVSKVLGEFTRRASCSRKQLPHIIDAASAAAKRSLANPDALITATYAKQASFAEEMMNRSGGLANCLDEWARQKQATPNDIFLFSVRAWETDGKKNISEIENAKKRGWLVVLFASEAGMLQEAEKLNIDYLIDNGARTGNEAEGAMNSIANSLNAWLWVSEYTAAMTRGGKHPGILKSILEDGHKEHNAQIQGMKLRHRQFDCKKPIATGSLASVYLKRVDKLIADLRSEKTQQQLDQSAGLIAAQLKSGGRVCATHATHLLTQEMGRNTPFPVHEFNVIWRAKTAFPKNVKKDDIVLYFSFYGMNTPYEDYATPLRQTGAKFITCHLKDKNKSNNAPDATAHIDASWSLPDSEVPVPFAPGQMAPVSGLNQGLVYRLLLEKAAAQLNSLQKRPQ
jgi:hypothetical protein